MKNPIISKDMLCNLLRQVLPKMLHQTQLKVLPRLKHTQTQRKYVQFLKETTTVRAIQIVQTRHILCNAPSDWVTSLICDSISCDILSQTRRHYVTSLFIGWKVNICSWLAFLCSWLAVLCSWQPLDLKAQQSRFSLSFWRENVNSALEWG